MGITTGVSRLTGEKHSRNSDSGSEQQSLQQTRENKRNLVPSFVVLYKLIIKRVVLGSAADMICHKSKEFCQCIVELLRLEKVHCDETIYQR